MIFLAGPAAANPGSQILHRAVWCLACKSTAPPRSLSSCWKRNRVDLSIGDVIVLYTDGITESMNLESDLFGEAGSADRRGAWPPRLE